MIAQNIANANVPGYKARDLVKPRFSDSLEKVTMSTATTKLSATDPGHIQGGMSTTSFQTTTKPNSVGDESISGNSVVLEEEVMKMSKNNLEYQQTTDLYRKMLEMIKTAIGNA